jgi:hypothetical protein
MYSTKHAPVWRKQLVASSGSALLGRREIGLTHPRQLPIANVIHQHRHWPRGWLISGARTLAHKEQAGAIHSFVKSLVPHPGYAGHGMMMLPHLGGYLTGLRMFMLAMGGMRSFGLSRGMVLVMIAE